jgi:hypothetical protein
MGLVEETAAYLDGPGRQEVRGLGRQGAIAYATESMRLTTRLMQLASWLLLQRAVSAGELTREAVEAEKQRINLERDRRRPRPRRRRAASRRASTFWWRAASGCTTGWSRSTPWCATRQSRRRTGRATRSAIRWTAWPGHFARQPHRQPADAGNHPSPAFASQPLIPLPGTLWGRTALTRVHCWGPEDGAHSYRVGKSKFRTDFQIASW